MFGSVNSSFELGSVCEKKIFTGSVRKCDCGGGGINRLIVEIDSAPRGNYLVIAQRAALVVALLPGLKMPTVRFLRTRRGPSPRPTPPGAAVNTPAMAGLD